MRHRATREMLGLLVVAAGSTSAWSHIPNARTHRAPANCGLTVASRRSVLSTAAAAFLSPAVAVNAFDLPPPTQMEDAAARSTYAAMGNPDKSKQQGSAFIALGNSDMASLQAMADSGWALDELADDAGKTVLHRAAQVGNAPAVTLLLKAGSPIDAYSAFRETPLHLAVRNNRLECVKLLVEAGASTSAQYGKDGDTALSLAQKYRFEAVVGYLTSKGAPGADRALASDGGRDSAPGFLPSPPCPKFLKAYLCN